MKKILAFVCFCALCAGNVGAAVRGDGATVRQGASSQTVRTSVDARARTGRTVGARTATNKNVTARATNANNGVAATRVAVNPRGATTNSGRGTVARARESGTGGVAVAARNAVTDVASLISGTRTGAQYEQCKNAFFTCMDQFCSLKNDDYRRCSCSNRVLELAEIRDTMQDASEQLTVFTENLEVVGMTAEQASAMRNASDGENALTADKSASKALLQAIMNSIRGEDSNVGGKYSDLNSISISFDTANAFGVTDAGQAVAMYNGQNLYSAVYPQCRSAVRADCNDASLQRAITAYLMAIEQDCNAVQTAITEQQKKMKSAVREGSAMLDLARVENRQKHNADDIATCVANVEAAVLSEEVCGAGYHKCLDNGEFIDVTTGKPIAGVERFYELEQLLTFASGTEDVAESKLSQVSANRVFVQNFESRVKKFALPALDKCTEQADAVWAEYLDKALLDIFYAQKSKVAEIKQGCFDYVSSCYMNEEQTLTDAMKGLTDDDAIVLQPDKIALSAELCRDYINSCNYMFDNNIVAEYIAQRQDTDTLTACRAVVKQCFDGFGGAGYENFYYPYSGLFATNVIGGTDAIDWFTLYDISGSDREKTYKSECAKQLAQIDSCSSPEMMERAFGGLDKMPVNAAINGYDENSSVYKYGTLSGTGQAERFGHRNLRSTGVATEVYNQIIDSLSTQCSNLQGRFVEYQFISADAYDANDFCKVANVGGDYWSDMNLAGLYGITDAEEICPNDYGLGVETQSWGVCSCWENGGRRSKNGASAKCEAVYKYGTNWNPAPGISTKTNQVCLQTETVDGKEVAKVDADTGKCLDASGAVITNLPEGVK